MKPTWLNGKEYGSPANIPQCICDQSRHLLYSKRRIIFALRWEMFRRRVAGPRLKDPQASQRSDDYLICLTWWHFGLFKLKELALQQTPAHVGNLPFIFRKRRHTKGSSVCAPLFIVFLSLFLKIVFMSTITNVWCEFCSRKGPSRSALLMSFLFASEPLCCMPAFSTVIDKQVIWVRVLFWVFFWCVLCISRILSRQSHASNRPPTNAD